MRSRKLVQLAFWLAATFWLLIGTAAQAAEPSCDVGSLRTQERPDPQGTLTEVQIGVLVADFLSVDDVDQSMRVDLLVIMEWHDPRLAAYAGCRLPRTSVWFPRIEILNSNQLVRERSGFTDRVEVAEGGEVRYVQRLNGTISTYHQLQKFPFDSHLFRVRAVAFDFPAEELVIGVDKDFTRLGDQLNIADWEVHSAAGETSTERIEELGANYSVFTLTISLSRNSGFYIWKALFPVTLIVMMSWSVFWISPERFGPQIGLSATAMLTLIAFQFFIASVLPRLSYFTILDKVVLGSTTLVFLTLVQALLTANLVSIDRSALAKRIDWHCRWLFPLLFVAWWSFSLL